jgi:hypothetical protein
MVVITEQTFELFYHNGGAATLPLNTSWTAAKLPLQYDIAAVSHLPSAAGLPQHTAHCHCKTVKCHCKVPILPLPSSADCRCRVFACVLLPPYCRRLPLHRKYSLV